MTLMIKFKRKTKWAIGIGICALILMVLFVPRKGMLAIDVSHHNGNVYPKVKKFKPKIMIAKATEGTYFIDPRFEKNYKIARDNNIIFGAYHFLNFNKDVKRQFDNYVRAVRSASSPSGYKMDLKPLLDVELIPGQSNLGYNQLRKKVRQFGELCYKEFGCYPIIYCNQGYRFFYFSLGFNDYEFWVRSLYTNPVLRCAIHQYKEDKVHNLDFNRVYDLKAIMLP